VAKPVAGWRPVAALLAGSSMWGVVWYPMRVLEAHGLAGPWLTAYVYGAATLGGLFLARGELRWIGRRPWLLLGLGLSAGWTNLAFVLAILDGNIMRVLLLFYLSPVWAVVLGWWVLKEKVSTGSIAVLIIALLGAALMLWRSGSGLPLPRDPTDWLALSSGFAFAVSNLFVRYGSEIPVSLKSLSAWIGVVVLATLVVGIQGIAVPSVTTRLVLGVLALGWFGTVVMTMLVQYGVSHMPVHRSAIILLFELVAGAISQQLLTNETMSALEWGGGVLVVAAALLSAWREKT
jgi:drug/metabolite transporter (DMT)-like permease